MKTLIFLLCFVCASAWWKEVNIPMRSFTEMSLRTSEGLRTPRRYKPSYQYKFPDQHFHKKGRTNIRVFGLQTSYAATLTLHDSTRSQADLRITLNKEVEDADEEWVCYSQYMDSAKPHKFSTPCYLDLYSDAFMWFTLLTKDDYIALYENGVKAPTLHLSQKDLKPKINFNKYDSFTVASEELAFWDFLGNRLVDEDLYYADLDDTLKKALKPATENFLKVKRHVWRCEHAKIQRSVPNNKVMKYKYIRFAQNHCPRWILHPYNDSSIYQEAILRVHDLKVPHRREFDVVKYFKNDY